MLRRDNHICNAIHRIRTSGINLYCVACCGSKFGLYTCGTANPVSLLCFYTFRIVYQIQIINQTLCILCNFQHPLRFCLTHNLTSAAFTTTVYYLFICKHTLARSTPVYSHFFFISKTVLK